MHVYVSVFWIGSDKKKSGYTVVRCAVEKRVMSSIVRSTISVHGYNNASECGTHGRGKTVVTACNRCVAGLVWSCCFCCCRRQDSDSVTWSPVRQRGRNLMGCPCRRRLRCFVSTNGGVDGRWYPLLSTFRCLHTSTAFRLSVHLRRSLNCSVLPIKQIISPERHTLSLIVLFSN